MNSLSGGIYGSLTFCSYLLFFLVFPTCDLYDDVATVTPHNKLCFEAAAAMPKG